ncbi:unnamed protein product [Sphacelaria rigidula]
MLIVLVYFPHIELNWHVPAFFDTLRSLAWGERCSCGHSSHLLLPVIHLIPVKSVGTRDQRSNPGGTVLANATIGVALFVSGSRFCRSPNIWGLLYPNLRRQDMEMHTGAFSLIGIIFSLEQVKMMPILEMMLTT